MNRDLINKFIAMPMAITVFKQDKNNFEGFRTGYVYEDMVDSIINNLQQDFYKLKKEIYSVHHLDIRKIEIGKYSVNGEIVNYTPEELRQLTSEIMSDYLYGDKAKPFKRKDRVWKDVNKNDK